MKKERLIKLGIFLIIWACMVGYRYLIDAIFGANSITSVTLFIIGELLAVSLLVSLGFRTYLNWNKNDQDKR